jgi:hypothetical protein
MTRVIEAGHYYAVQGPSNVSLMGWEKGQELASVSGDSKQVLFVDDYHTAQPFLCDDEEFFTCSQSAAVVGRMHAEADKVYLESTFAAQATTAAETLLETRMAKLKKSVLSVAGIRLGQYDPDSQEDFLPTCVLLDFLFLQAKVQLGGDQVVILPHTYKAQQKQLETVLDRIAIPDLKSYEPIFFSPEPQVGILL